MTTTLIDIIDVKNKLGEGIIWDHEQQVTWWTDIEQSKLYRYSPARKELQSWDTSERLCCFAPVHNSEQLMCAFESGFALYQPERNELKWIKKLEQDNPGTRFNDGRTDRQGRLWAGTMVENQEQAQYAGSLYCLNHDLSISKHLSGLSITNSLCWSPDSKTLYHTDTPTQVINQYSFDAANATLGSAQTLCTTDADCFPDGSIVDAQGYVWNAQWGGSKVVRYNPENGNADFELTLPTPQPTCVAFGGENLNLILVTSAWADLENPDEHAGDLFIYQTEFTGLKESPFIMKA